MDIEYEEGNDRGNNRSSSLNGHRVSMKSRKSNESCFSIGGTHYFEIPASENQKYLVYNKESVWSQISPQKQKTPSIIGTFLSI